MLNRDPKSAIGKSAIGRRVFLSSILLLAFSTAASVSAETLQVLKQNDFERLKLDFNANRSKVRLLLVLSPT